MPSDADFTATVTDKIIRTLEDRAVSRPPPSPLSCTTILKSETNPQPQQRSLPVTNELRFVSHRHDLTITLTIASGGARWVWWRSVRQDYPEAVTVVVLILSAYTFIFVTCLFTRFVMYVLG